MGLTETCRRCVGRCLCEGLALLSAHAREINAASVIVVQQGALRSVCSLPLTTQSPTTHYYTNLLTYLLTYLLTLLSKIMFRVFPPLGATLAARRRKW